MRVSVKNTIDLVLGSRRVTAISKSQSIIANHPAIAESARPQKNLDAQCCPHVLDLFALLLASCTDGAGSRGRGLGWRMCVVHARGKTLTALLL